MTETEPQNGVRADVYIQAILSAEDNDRLNAVVDAGDWKKGAFVARAIMERVERYEKKPPAR